jgi:two-component system cell cycle sensor histidine kinase/response regulator CckA
MTGYTAEEVIGKTPRILQGPRTDKAVLSRLRKNLERGEAFEGEAINYRKDGKEFDLEWQIAPLRDAHGKITHFVATQHDVTARKKLEAQFRQSQKMEGIGQLAGGVAHDFNNILAIIEMQSGLLKSSGGLSVEQSEFNDEISITVQRAAALTRQLLLFSRREVFQPRDLDLSESITNTAKMLKRTLGENIQMQLKLASQPMFIHADSGMMDQVLLNLAVNARDAMPNGGQLIIETSGVEFDEFAASQSAQTRVGSFVRLSVSDSGCGIPPENLTKIFEPFFTTKDVGKGTGLGLATVFGIVQQHQGWINVYSEVNHGTTFRVYLPRLAKNGSKSSQATPTAMRGGNETILLVEDDPSLRASVRKALSQLGYRILETPTGVKALEVWKENRNEILLLLTDLVMPDGMTGKDLAQRILQENPKLKVIYMSGYSAEVVGKDFPLKEGVNFLTKPFQAHKLAQTIRESLDAKV